MKTIFKPAGIALALLLSTTRLGLAIGTETLQPVVSEPVPHTILVADDDDDRPFWWRHGQRWHGDDDCEDDDGDRWNDDDDGDD